MISRHSLEDRNNNNTPCSGRDHWLALTIGLATLVFGSAAATQAASPLPAATITTTTIAAAAETETSIPFLSATTTPLPSSETFKSSQTISKASALAAEAKVVLMAHAYDPDPAARAQALSRVLELTSQALEQEPDHVEALLQYAAAIGYQARSDRSPGKARAALAHINRALALTPDDGFVILAVAIWHGETRADGGFLGRVVLGADLDLARQRFEEALRLLPQEPLVPVIYASVLLRLSVTAERDLVKSLLREALARPPESRLDSRAHDNARLLLAAVESGNKRSIQRAIEQTLPYRKP